ncbi:hypothetical protein POM88_040418 [Heracleum sosnowskyi]|uniref:Dof zinc finger protein n=1 Tax=Heracleum sosnowskyi TaxID=360622 RepID=A0AAD8HEZ3_9APIA|nr:hypothetical protein POM88_040418 [Heracleum sosnowskyi]
MAGALRLQNKEMERNMQLDHLERQRQWFQQQPPEMCPRCNSMDTKFCYFNNYSAEQPRYLCKACQRQWTKGGRLRDIPVGGSVRPRPDGDGLPNPQAQNPPGLVMPATPWTTPGGPITRPGGAIPLGAVNQIDGLYAQNPQGSYPLGLVMTGSARVFSLPSPVLIIRPDGTGGQNRVCYWLTEPGNIFWPNHSRPVYRWVNGFWHGPFYGTSTTPLP